MKGPRQATQRNLLALAFTRPLTQPQAPAIFSYICRVQMGHRALPPTTKLPTARTSTAMATIIIWLRVSVRPFQLPIIRLPIIRLPIIRLPIIRLFHLHPSHFELIHLGMLKFPW